MMCLVHVAMLVSMLMCGEYCIEARKNCWLSEEHTGHMNFTMYGRTCQSWTSQSPHSHERTDDKFPYDCSASEAENYCRDPSGYGKLWCYTINSEKRWEECEGVPICNVDCYFKEDVGGFRGTVSKTVEGFPCQAWSEQTPHEHHFNQQHMFPEDQSVLAANNYCRDPEGVERLWCYTMHPDFRLGWCPVPICERQ